MERENKDLFLLLVTCFFSSRSVFSYRQCLSLCNLCIAFLSLCCLDEHMREACPLFIGLAYPFLALSMTSTSWLFDFPSPYQLTGLMIWEELEEVVRGVRHIEKLLLGGNFNRHIGTISRGYDDMNDYNFGDWNNEVSLTDFVKDFDLVISYLSLQDRWSTWWPIVVWWIRPR